MRETTRIAIDRRELDQLERGVDPGLTFRAIVDAVDQERLLHQVEDAHERAEAAVRILEDGLRAQSEGELRVSLETCDVPAIEGDFGRR